MPSAPRKSASGASTSCQARKLAVVPEQGLLAQARESREGEAGCTEHAVVPSVDLASAGHAMDLCGATEAGLGQTEGGWQSGRVDGLPNLKGIGSEERGAGYGGQGGGLRLDRAPVGEILLEGGEVRGGGWEAADMEQRDADQEIAARGLELYLEVSCRKRKRMHCNTFSRSPPGGWDLHSTTSAKQPDLCPGDSLQPKIEEWDG